MKASLRVLAYATNAAVCGTGLVYAWCLYLSEPTDPLAAVNHPWQPLAQQGHVLSAPAWLFALGVLWAAHAGPRLTAGGTARRRTGITLLACALPMAVSGYLLQTAVDDGWRTAWLTVHLTTSALWLLGFAGHLLARRRG